ncbi:hypothetical protein [Geobacter sp. SVR]|uniref:hypothetical protein n=1 Tax=Geobacter sp. SVR TaxID=2495594 RepID=UPI00143F0432|nr:hypothetical protein [Geobacter sp. SVR]BCS53903.1 hypothetical protein GSVR_22110 [Geobacter sp. SVR]GCF86319.1 hypothetical protein GSbR_29190 [Geobacter sp. SVR]
MNMFYLEFIKHGRKLAEDRGINWDIPLDSDGMAADGIGWNLTIAAGDTPPPSYYLRDFTSDKRTVEILKQEEMSNENFLLPFLVLSKAWQDLVKAAVANQLFYRKNSPTHVSNNIIRPLKVIATCAFNTEPWALGLNDLVFAIKIGTKIQASGKLGDLIKGIVKTIIDVEHIADACPLYPSLPMNRLLITNNRARCTKSVDELLNDLGTRKRAERLPERRAFWELVRIIFTEKPKTLTDEFRFTALKVLLTCGLRIGEAVLLPADWKRTKEHFDHRGRPAGELGGYSSTLMLRHFAEKQKTDDSAILVESFQYVPEMFTDLLTEALDRAVRISQPFRETLRLQVETGRTLPWYDKKEFVRVTDLYPRLTGNPFWLTLEADYISSIVNAYRDDFSPEVLHNLREKQTLQYKEGSEITLSTALYAYLHRLRSNIKDGKTAIRFYRPDGSIMPIKSRMLWGEVCLNIGELEGHIQRDTPTKIPDTLPLKLENGIFQPWEFMFLMPKRSVAEERDGRICDVTRYFSVGIPDPVFLDCALGDKVTFESIFERYGETEDDRKLTLKSHSLRHLQNTELFRLGVADTIITKRYNRRSVAQSYEYDHRSLAEELDQIELPPNIEISLGEKATIAAKMIKAGKATGPIVEAFKRIQQLEGDDAAFQYLRGEADGFHATPFGHCFNSFTVDPCPKNLECFAGCRHLTATNLPSNRKYLLKLEERFSTALEAAKSRSSKSIGRDNQIRHAQDRLDAVHALLATPDGEKVFPDGPDFSLSPQPGSVLDE